MNCPPLSATTIMPLKLIRASLKLMARWHSGSGLTSRRRWPGSRNPPHLRADTETRPRRRLRRLQSLHFPDSVAPGRAQLADREPKPCHTLHRITPKPKFFSDKRGVPICWLLCDSYMPTIGLIGPKHRTRLHWAANRHGTRRNCLDVDKTAVSQ
jgi:hypothetical protein